MFGTSFGCRVAMNRTEVEVRVLEGVVEFRLCSFWAEGRRVKKRTYLIMTAVRNHSWGSCGLRKSTNGGYRDGRGIVERCMLG